MLLYITTSAQRLSILSTTSTTEQHFYILHHYYSWAALLSNRSQSELLSVRRSPGRSRNQRKTLFPHKQQSIATLLGLNCVTEDKLDLRASMLWLQEFLPFYFPKAGYLQILVDTIFLLNVLPTPFSSSWLKASTMTKIKVIVLHSWLWLAQIFLGALPQTDNEWMESLVEHSNRGLIRRNSRQSTRCPGCKYHLDTQTNYTSASAKSLRMHFILASFLLFNLIVQI